MSKKRLEYTVAISVFSASFSLLCRSEHSCDFMYTVSQRSLAEDIYRYSLACFLDHNAGIGGVVRRCCACVIVIPACHTVQHNCLRMHASSNTSVTFHLSKAC